ncbi:MAG: ubiquinone biosynthesis regulatory protein kinase UbiB [Gammaproteobacteria bacterium]|nr:ubiquinone biosynthesis regulatory protein kinase UbiB [Gammaproteobacteria bacterium]
MSAIKQAWRLIYINHVLAKSGLDQMLVSIPYFSMFRFIAYLNPWNWFRAKPFDRGVALRETLEQLGPIFVKFGQALSTRPDIIPADIMVELCRLQDNVPPFSSEQVVALLEAVYGESPHTLFDDFDPQPLASASVAQVHTACLKTGEPVVIKVLRPDIRKVIDRDLGILKKMARLLDLRGSISKRLRPKEVVAEFERHLLDELNLQREAANGAQLRRNFQQSPLLYVPQIYWDYVRENVLVMERIHGIPIADVAQLDRHGIDRKALAERGLEIFFTQVFRDCFFHADMHPGNIFVAKEPADAPQYMCVDFGIIGSLSESDQRYLAENLYAFFNRDYRKIAILHVESGWVARDTRVDAFESAMRTVCEPIFERPLKDISFAQLVFQLFQVGRRFHMEVQPQLVLLQKTLFAVEGLGRQIYPELNLWATGKPFLEHWLRDQMGPRAFFKHMRENAPFLIEQLPYMPRLINDILSQLKEQTYPLARQDKPVAQKMIIKNGTWRGVGLGVMLMTVVVAGLTYGKWLFWV